MEQLPDNLENFSQPFIINGYNLEFFPFPPHDCQKLMMQNFLNAFEKNENLILESPTGTGKSLSFLASCIAYFRKQENNIEFNKERTLRYQLNDLLDIFDQFESNFKKYQIEAKDMLDNPNTLNYNYHIDKITLFKILENITNNLSAREFLQTQLKEYFIDIIYRELNDEPIDKKLLIGELKEKIQIARNKILDKFQTMTFTHSVIYAVRTNSQIDVIHEELKKLPKFYEYAFLKSRDFLCLNEKFNNKKGTMLNTICKANRKNCNFFYNIVSSNESKYAEYSKSLSDYKREKMCPYYGEIFKSRRAQILVCTYNHILSWRCASIFKCYMINPKIVIDEAHNILDACDGQLNVNLSVQDFYNCIRDIRDTREYFLNKRNEIKPSTTENDEETMTTDTFLSMCDSVIFGLFMIMNNLIILNQTDMASCIDYNGFFIFRVIHFLFSLDHYSSGKLSNRNVVIRQDRNMNREEFFKLYDLEGNSLIFNKINYKKFLNDLNSIVKNANCKMSKDISSSSQISDFIELIFDLFGNFNYNFDLEDDAFIKDYILTANGIEIKNRIYENFEEYKTSLQQLVGVGENRNNKNFEKYWDKFLKIVGKINNKEFKMMCMNPYVAFSRVKKYFRYSSLCLMSGTIQPFEFYESELKTKFHNKIVTSHIINKSNVNILIFTKPLLEKNNKVVTGRPKLNDLQFTHRIVSIPTIKNLLFEETFSIINDIIDSGSIGNLIFMKSFQLLDQFKGFILKHLKDSNFEVKEEMSTNSFCVFDMNSVNIMFLAFDSNKIGKNKKELIINKYKEMCKDGVKSCLFSVMKGSFSEGVNFENEETESVFICGIPYADLTNDFVTFKMKYLEEKHSTRKSIINGNEWYDLQAMIALNQSVGRAIRRKNDHATVCIIDSQITKLSLHSKLSKWIREITHTRVVPENYKNCLIISKEFNLKFKFD